MASHPAPRSAPPQLFPTIDANHDNLVSLEELFRHLYENGKAISHRRADLEFEEADANKDGARGACGGGSRGGRRRASRGGQPGR